MATSLNDFYNFCNAVAKKDLVGGTVTIAERDILANRAQMQVFEKDRLMYLQKREISQFLKTFLKSTVYGVPLTGLVNVPSDYEHTASQRCYYAKAGGKSQEVEILEVKNLDWGRISASQLQKPTKRFPKYNEFANQFRYLPKDIGIVMLDYFKTPIAPVWGFTVVSGRPVYNAATTTNFEFDEFAVNEVAAVFLSLLGISIKDSELLAYSQQYKQENTPIL